MSQQRPWAAVVSEEMYAAERLYAFDTLVLPATLVLRGTGAPDAPQPGDLIALIAPGEPPVVFGLGRVRGTRNDGGVPVRYTHRLLDEPIPLEEAQQPGLTRLTTDAYGRLAAQVGADTRTDADRAEWFVSLALPIEASSPAEAVREFWTYVAKLGPRELPAFVWPRGDELAMHAYVLGAETNLDPEEDDD